MAELTYAQVSALLKYDSETGRLFWLPRLPSMFKDGEGRYISERNCKIWNKKFAGKEAFVTSHSNGYLIGAISNKKYFAHRIIWLLVYGNWPPEQIDHVNGVRHDNRLVNLRTVSHAENMRNVKRSANNKSGMVGVSWHKNTGKWRVNIATGNKAKHLGLFSDFDDAVVARKTAEQKYSFHRNHGRGC